MAHRAGSPCGESPFRQKGPSAPVKAIELSGESPDRGNRYVPVVEGNCVFKRKGGEQPETNEQPAIQMNSIQPSLSGSGLGTGEPLTTQQSQTRPTPGGGKAPQDRVAATTVTKQ